jgi:hypothetical protein
MAYLSAVPIRLNDGRKPNGLRVLELKEALESFGVPETGHAQSNPNKLIEYKYAMSKPHCR